MEDLPTIIKAENDQNNGKELGLGLLSKAEYTPEDLKDIIRNLENSIYKATDIFEEHEVYHGTGPGCLIGNGHNRRQKAAQLITNLFVESLRSKYQAWFEVDGFGGYKLKKRD